LDLASVVGGWGSHDIFGRVSFVYCSLGLVVAAIGIGQRRTAKQGSDTERHDEGKDSLHVNLLRAID